MAVDILSAEKRVVGCLQPWAWGASLAAIAAKRGRSMVGVCSE